jgi:hypothetical protein
LDRNSRTFRFEEKKKKRKKRINVKKAFNVNSCGRVMHR